MKKYMTYILFLFLQFLFLPGLVSADYEAKFLADGTCALRAGSTGNCFYADTKFNSLVKNSWWLDTGDPITVSTSVTPVAAPKTGSGSECKSTFSYVTLVYQNSTYKGYVCTDNIKVANITDELKSQFQAAGFPESYWANLAVLKEAHPTWQFIAIPTELDFKTAVDNEDVGNKSLYQSTTSSSQGYLSTKPENYDWEKDSFKYYDGTTWYAANNQTIAYYMDPRNFLTDMHIFQFESVSFNPEFQTEEAVKATLGNTYISQFLSYFMDASVKWKMNPVYLAALSLQEIGTSTTAGRAISGAPFVYNNVEYRGFYNFYNIGATSSAGGGATLNGLAYAAGVKDGKIATSYGRPWNSEEKAILGGAEFMYKTYVQYGQDTTYFKKWNTVANYAKKNGMNYYNNYTHQYQQGILAPTSEALRTYKSYVNLGLLESGYVFYIPVYKNMPASTSLPPTGNPNNRLKTIKVDGKAIDGYSSSNFNYKLAVANEVSTIKVEATTINSGATVTGTGTISLKEGENAIKLNVKAQNGDMQTYTLTVTRASNEQPIVYPKVSEIMAQTSYIIKNNYLSNLTFSTTVPNFKVQINKISETAVVTVKSNNKEKTTGNIVAGDVITVISGEDKETYTAILYGDTNGDNAITVLDLLKVQKHILGSNPLNGAFKEAADVNKDGKVTVLDLLKVQKHILGDSAISQK